MSIKTLAIISTIINLSLYIGLAFYIGWWTLVAIPVIHIAFYPLNMWMIKRNLNNGHLTL